MSQDKPELLATANAKTHDGTLVEVRIYDSGLVQFDIGDVGYSIPVDHLVVIVAATEQLRGMQHGQRTDTPEASGVRPQEPADALRPD